MRTVLLWMTLVVMGCSESESAASIDESPIKRIALSFDDAPKNTGPVFTGDERTTRLITALDAADAGEVVFFVTTSNFDRPDGRSRITRYAEAGHLVANHSHSHWWLKRTETDAYLDDIDRAEELLEGFANRRAWFRFPFLDEGRPLEQRDAVRVALKERGLQNGFVSVDNYDWYLDMKWKQAVDAGLKVDIEALRTTYVDMLMGAVTFYENLANEALGISPAHVLLLHENDVAAMFIGDLIQALRDDGWTIVSPDEAYADPMYRQIPKTLMTGQGQVSALAIEAGIDNRTLTHLAIEEDQIDALLQERRIFE